ncbi:alanine racemase [Limosilactobacillus sp. STM2_1]|uniref:Alanine racemase n=1 Tax=Limosilactobacillus rudii TaxID=2759755 RepID=A0A7W3YNV0_9LACO|nr:alanine racemase [Limosilactobacillus rudii]MBB1079604.1 alanine racemase [Limosilactobacillus rudii]MBB1097682.1 alanine racemase [Limosilactobacillus rudii]MCD7134791.1 alanine racemase [Limosilactobacillus rudii]
MINGRLRGTSLVVDLAALQHNIQEQKKALPANSRILAVVKANAYGNGLVPVANAALNGGASGLCVAILDEALALRDNGIAAMTLVLGITPVENAVIAANAGISLTVGSLDWLEQYHQLAQVIKPQKPLKVHLGVDSGMGRIGFTDIATFQQAVELLENPEFEFEGMFTHFATADSPDDAYFKRQVQQWQKYIDSIENLPPYVHMANSATGLWHQGVITANTIRMGISMYGQNPSGRDLKLTLDLQPVSSLVSSIVFVKKLKAGRSVSYGATYTAAKDEWLATLPIGYADGYPRCMTGFKVLVDGQFCDIAGRVCMDQMMVKLPKYYPVGTPVVLMGKSGDKEITANDLAEQAGTINYEILTNISNRVHRVYHYSND